MLWAAFSYLFLQAAAESRPRQARWQRSAMQHHVTGVARRGAACRSPAEGSQLLLSNRLVHHAHCAHVLCLHAGTAAQKAAALFWRVQRWLFSTRDAESQQQLDTALRVAHLREQLKELGLADLPIEVADIQRRVAQRCARGRGSTILSCGLLYPTRTRMRHCDSWAQRRGHEADGWPLTDGPLAVAAAIPASQADDCDAEAAAMSQCREFAGLAGSFHTLFGGSIWWPVGLRWNEGFSERRHTARASASATAAATAHLSIVSRGETAKRGPQAGKLARLVWLRYRARFASCGTRKLSAAGCHDMLQKCR